MNRAQVNLFHDEISNAVRPILAKYGMDLLPSTLHYTPDTISLPIKGVKRVTISEAVFVDDTSLKFGFAGPGAKAWVTDRDGSRREVIITERKQKKYSFYFAGDAARRPMLGHFSLFSANR